MAIVAWAHALGPARSQPCDLGGERRLRVGFRGNHERPIRSASPPRTLPRNTLRAIGHRGKGRYGLASARVSAIGPTTTSPEKAQRV